MSRAWAAAAFVRRRFSLSGLRPREVRSWLTRQRAAFASVTAEVWAVGPSVEAHTVAAEAGPAPAATAVRRRRGMTPRQVRIYLPYRVDHYPGFSLSTYVLGEWPTPDPLENGKFRGEGRLAAPPAGCARC